MRAAADIGGTFTDVVLEHGGALLTRKVLTTSQRPEQAVLDGLQAVLADARLSVSDIDVFMHGTTLATNAIIERRGARTALVTTEGFRDVIEIANESRYDQYDLSIEKPKPLVPRTLRLTVAERMDVHGRVRLSLDEDGVRRLVPVLARERVESVAIVFLHAYANPEHEQRAAAILLEAMPGLRLTLSSEVCPEVREYERASTAVANAYVQPLMGSYLERMQAMLAERSFRGAIYLVTSGGGLTTIDAARRFPVRLVESGPAGGAIFAAEVARNAGERKALAFDMGGTTAKICLIDGFEPQTARVCEVDRAARFLKGSGIPLRIPVIELVEIGAGGGSIARVDGLKRVVVGPESAGSEPGPACYGRGGTKPTVTDADVVLGLIEPQSFAGGTIALSPDRARAALAMFVGNELALDTDSAAHAVHEIVCENMASAARVHAVERGAVIGQHTLIAFGGAAPLHAARVAEKIGVARVIIPRNAGVGSAIGFLAAPIAYEVVRSRHARLDRFDAEGVACLLADMASEALAIVGPGARGTPVEERRIAFMRYVGQGHEIMVRLPARDLTAADAGMLRTAFEIAYAELFERHIPEAPIEALSWSVLVTTEASGGVRASGSDTTIPAMNEPIGTRSVFDAGTMASIDVPLYERGSLPHGARIAGPAIIAEAETSTFVSAAFEAHLDASGSIVLDRIPTQATAQP